MSHIWGLSVLCIAMAVTSNANQQCPLRIFPTESPTWLINPRMGFPRRKGWSQAPFWENLTLPEKSRSPLLTQGSSYWTELPVTHMNLIWLTILCLYRLDDWCSLGCIQPFWAIYHRTIDPAPLVPSLPLGSIIMITKLLNLLKKSSLW